MAGIEPKFLGLARDVKVLKFGLISNIILSYSKNLAGNAAIHVPCNTTLHTLQQHTITISPALSLMRLERFKGPVKKCQK